ncbi:uncharacterized protein DNG_07342 [Cephalotrichum gorgonifer]|uniref:Zn(2)-C6 fungal-type domain-containing protein n=1 Tax=Cephalotrichum gorgonifer TaxID=2041049 RepID=A0AAE8N284_9PEZI|nr:uncharacterized protein DNG_07342 [Cephalotrichum gorgonifer]
MSNQDKSQRCWECRTRRLVCDLAKPACKKCARRGVTCPGYDEKPLKWVTQRLKQPATKDHNLGTRRSPPSNTPSPGTELVPLSPIRAVPPPSLELGDSAQTPFEAMVYYNACIGPDLNWTGDTDVNNPYLIPLAHVSAMPDSIIQTIICSSLGHRIMQLQDAPQQDQRTLATRLQSHRGKALRVIAQQLCDPREQTSDVTLAAVIVLLLVEIQNCLTLDWRQHGDGALTIIDMRGGMAKIMSGARPWSHILSCLLIIEVMGCTTAPRTKIERQRAHRQMDMISQLPQLYGNGLNTAFPCPPELFADIIRINYLRSVSPTDIVPDDEWQGMAVEILQHILVFSPDTWVASIMPCPTHCDGGIASEASRLTSPVTTLAPIPRTSEDWVRVGRIYRAAAALYCMASCGLMAKANRPGNICTGAVGLWPSLLGELFSDLKAVAAGSTSIRHRFRKLMPWPLVIAGIALDEDDKLSREFILRELQWISLAAGTATPLVACNLLRDIWASLGHLSRQRSWDELFDKPYVFAI